MILGIGAGSYCRTDTDIVQAMMLDRTFSILFSPKFISDGAYLCANKEFEARAEYRERVATEHTIVHSRHCDRCLIRSSRQKRGCRTDPKGLLFQPQIPKPPYQKRPDTSRLG